MLSVRWQQGYLTEKVFETGRKTVIQGWSRGCCSKRCLGVYPWLRISHPIAGKRAADVMALNSGGGATPADPIAGIIVNTAQTSAIQ
jgi:hypothetical protein